MMNTKVMGVFALLVVVLSVAWFAYARWSGFHVLLDMDEWVQGRSIVIDMNVIDEIAI